MKALLLTLVLFTSALQAQTISEDRPELEAQRRGLESHIFSKLDTAIGTIAERGSYILNVAVAIKKLPPEVIDVAKESATKFPLEVNRSFNGADGLVPLSKIGVWQASSSGSIAETKTLTRQFLRFSDLIESIVVDIYLDPDRVNSAQKDTIGKIAQEILKSVSPIEPTLNVTAMKIFYPKKIDDRLKTEVLNQFRKEVDAAKSVGFAQRLVEFKTPLAIIFTALLLFGLGLIMNRRQALHDERRLKLDEDISRRQEEKLRESIASNDVNVAVTEKTELTEALSKVGKRGFEQFAEAIGTEPARAALLIKQWIYSADIRADSALALLPRFIPMSELTPLLHMLSEADRKEWSRLILKPLGGMRISEYDDYVAMSLASSIVEPEHEIDDRVKQVLATLTPQEGAECIWADRSIGVLLVETLPTLQISRILSLLDVETLRAVALASSSTDKMQLNLLAANFEQVLNRIRSAAKERSSAFVERVPELIREIGFAKEPALYDSVAQTQNVQMLQQIATEYFPAELISELPPDIIKTVFDRMPLAERADLTYSLPANLKDLLLRSTGGGRLMEVLEIEMEQIEINDQRKQAVLRAHDRLWQSFVDAVRHKINNTPEITQELEGLIMAWASRRIAVIAAGGGRRAAA